MERKERIERIINALVLLVLLFLSNFLIGGLLAQLMFIGLQDVVGDLEVIRLLVLALPGCISTTLVYLVYIKISFMKKMSLPIGKFKAYMFIQGLVMMVLEPMALFISIMATDAPGSGIKEMLIGFSFIWVPVNVVIWLLFILSLMFKEKTIEIPPL